MQEYQCGIRSEDLIPFGSFPTEFDPIGLPIGTTESWHDKWEGVAILFMFVVLAILLLGLFVFYWVKDGVSNFMAKLRHRRFHNEEANQVLKEQVPDHIR